jgi:hypothetical protein
MPHEIGLEPRRHRDLEGRTRDPWFRRIALGVLALLPLAGLLNLLGQRPEAVAGAGPSAVLRVSAPTVVRGGLLFEAHFDVDARTDLREPVLRLASGWLDGLTLNTLEPAPADEAWRDGALELGYPPLAAGRRLTVVIQYQVNPTSAGRRSQDVAVLDGATPVAAVDRSLLVLP